MCGVGNHGKMSATAQMHKSGNENPIVSHMILLPLYQGILQHNARLLFAVGHGGLGPRLYSIKNTCQTMYEEVIMSLTHALCYEYTLKVSLS